MAAEEPSRKGREHDELRPIELERKVAPYAEGSCLVAFGATRVLCAASRHRQVLCVRHFVSSVIIINQGSSYGGRMPWQGAWRGRGPPNVSGFSEAKLTAF